MSGVSGDRGGLLVTFEGPEGSGKSTLVAALAERLRAEGRDPLVLREPGGTPVGERIRAVLLDPGGGGMEPLTELLLMVASRAQLVRQEVRPALAAGRIVLCDRFADASVAYQGAGRGLGTELVRRLNDVALEGLVPDLTFLLLLAPEEGRRRQAGRVLDRLDQETAEFHARVHAAYVEMARDPRWRVLDALAPPAQVLAQAIKELKSLEQAGPLNRSSGNAHARRRKPPQEKDRGA